MSQLSPLAQRAELIKSGLSYSEAQSVIMASSGHDIYRDPEYPDQIKIVNSPAPEVQSEKTLNIVNDLALKIAKAQSGQVEPEQIALPASLPDGQATPFVPTPLVGRSEPWEKIGEMNLGGSYMYPQAQQTGIVEGIQGLFSNIGDILPLMLIMGMGGGGSGLKSMLPMLLLLPMLGAGNSNQQQGFPTLGSTVGMTMGNVNASEVALWAMLPKMGSMATFLLGGVSGFIGQSLKPKKRRYTKRTYSRPYYPRRYRR